MTLSEGDTVMQGAGACMIPDATGVIWSEPSMTRAPYRHRSTAAGPPRSIGSGGRVGEEGTEFTAPWQCLHVPWRRDSQHHDEHELRIIRVPIGMA